MPRTHDTLMVRVVGKSFETPEVCLFELAAQPGEGLPPFSAGAHIDVYVPGGPVRQYSLCNAPDESHRYVIGVLRTATSRGGSSAMHEQVKEGDLLKISLPRNQFPLRPAGRTLLFAGGIGITPMLSMAEHLAKTDADFFVHYCARSRERTAFLDRLRASPFGDKVSLHFDDDGPSRQLDLAAVLRNTHEDSRLYVCGPQGFMDSVLEAARMHGWAPDRLHSESFGATSGATTQGKVFEVALQRTGGVYTIPPEKSVAAVLIEAGIDIPLSCEAGFCGTCVTPVLDGTPDHRDTFLTDEERARNDRFTPCCSRAVGARLVLDL